MKRRKTFSKEVHNQQTNELIYTVDAEQKVIQYYLSKDSNQKEVIKQITFIGFDKLPAGFWNSGYGFTKGGTRVLYALDEATANPLDLYFVKDGKSIITEKAGKSKVVFNYNDFKVIKDLLREISQQRNKESNNVTQFYLHKFFPNYFSEPEEEIQDDSTYRKGELSALLEKREVLENLSKNDQEKLHEIYSAALMQQTKGRFSKQKLFQLAETKSETEVIYLEKVIQQFEQRLKSKSQRESTWQEFLREYILLFNSSYTKLLDKESIALGGKFPDFMMIDLYNYLDIYEIKTPKTQLLKKDESRNNYFWDTEISKAISQVENYVHQIHMAGPLFIQTIKDKYDIDIRVVKPRGFIIAGESTQLENQKMKDDFRLLSNSLKNIDVILYDDFLNNLKNFLNKISNKQ